MPRVASRSLSSRPGELMRWKASSGLHGQIGGLRCELRYLGCQPCEVKGIFYCKSESVEQSEALAYRLLRRLRLCRQLLQPALQLLHVFLRLVELLRARREVVELHVVALQLVAHLADGEPFHLQRGAQLVLAASQGVDLLRLLLVGTRGLHHLGMALVLVFLHGLPLLVLEFLQGVGLGGDVVGDLSYLLARLVVLDGNLQLYFVNGNTHLSLLFYAKIHGLRKRGKDMKSAADGWRAALCGDINKYLCLQGRGP